MSRTTAVHGAGAVDARGTSAPTSRVGARQLDRHERLECGIVRSGVYGRRPGRGDVPPTEFRIELEKAREFVRDLLAALGWWVRPLRTAA